MSASSDVVILGNYCHFLVFVCTHSRDTSRKQNIINLNHFLRIKYRVC